jgi:hypothetical protein
MLTGRRNGVPFAFKALRSSASVHSSRKYASRRDCVGADTTARNSVHALICWRIY